MAGYRKWLPKRHQQFGAYFKYFEQIFYYKGLLRLAKKKKNRKQD